MKVKIGVLGAGRGTSMMRYLLENDDAILTAICDYNKDMLAKVDKNYKLSQKGITLYSDFDEFLAKADIDAVVLANYANDHAPFAIKAMEAGKHVMSEVLPVETLKEAVELCECVEKHKDLVYAYAENYCFFNTTQEMKKLFKDGTMGEFEYGEGEYIHNCAPGWHGLTGANPEHWRNIMSSFYYCTHSCGPLIHISGQRPVKVMGIEGRYNESIKKMGALGSSVAVEMVTLENGGIFKSVHGLGLSESSVWYSVYGENGRLETNREYTNLCNAPLSMMYGVTTNDSCDPVQTWHAYRPSMPKKAKSYGHAGSDWFTMHNFVKKIKGEDADVVDVYEALDMYFVGHFGYLSALNKGIAMDIPDFRDKDVREKYRFDTYCPDPKKASEGQLLPSNTYNAKPYPDAYKNMKAKLDNPKKADKFKMLLRLIGFALKRRTPIKK